MIAVICDEGFGCHDRPLSIASDMDHVFLLQQFLGFALAEYTAGRHVLLIMDEVQNIKTDLLRELQLLAHVNSDKEGMLQIIMVGQSELQDTPHLPELRQLAPATYVDHRLKHVGGVGRESIVEALRYIQVEVGGIFCMINKLRELALIYITDATEKGWLWSRSRRSSKKGWSSNLLNPILVFSNRAISRVKAAK